MMSTLPGSFGFAYRRGENYWGKVLLTPFNLAQLATLPKTGEEILSFYGIAFAIRRA